MTFLLTYKSCCLSYIVFHVPSQNVLSHRGPWNTVTLFLFIIFCSRKYFKAYRNLEAPNPDLAFWCLIYRLNYQCGVCCGYLRTRGFKMLFKVQVFVSFWDFWQSDDNWGPPWSDGCRYLYMTDFWEGRTAGGLVQCYSEKKEILIWVWGFSSTCKQQFRPQKAEII